MWSLLRFPFSQTRYWAHSHSLSLPMMALQEVVMVLAAETASAAPCPGRPQIPWRFGAGAAAGTHGGNRFLFLVRLVSWEDRHGRDEARWLLHTRDVLVKIGCRKAQDLGWALLSPHECGSEQR